MVATFQLSSGFVDQEYLSVVAMALPYFATTKSMLQNEDRCGSVKNFKTLPQVSESTARVTVAYFIVETLQCFSSL